MNLAITVVFLLVLGAAIYWLTSGEPEKRLGRIRMLEDLKKEQGLGPESYSGIGYDVKALVDDDYYWHLLEDLGRARESIEVLMFEIKLGKSADNPANRLVSALISAKERGVLVRTRLEQSDLDRSLTRTNRASAELLKSKGIHTYFDLPDVETHAKAVLIDGRILYTGNHNWSESALMRNKEVSVRVESPKAISAMRRSFDRFDRALEKARLGAGS